ncbi:MAG: transketolase family protein [Solirubrobacteraceae bacterium]
MRRELVEALVQLAHEDDRIVLMTGDLGFAALEPFMERFPDRFFNAGVAEQNMVGMATGLAEAGLTPYVYSISTFASMRPYEFIRNGPVLHGLPVRVVGIGEGVDYGHNGMTHYALEDVALMRAQPGLTLVVPGASEQVATIMRTIQQQPGPVYLRISKQSISIPALAGRFELGRAEQIAYGEDVALIALGSMSEFALEASKLLAGQGVSASVTVVSSVSPPPIGDLLSTLGDVRVAVSVEAAYVNGGLGSLVAEVIAEHGIGCRLVRAGVSSLPLGISGGRAYMHEQLGLSPDRLAATVTEALAVRRR